MLSLIEHLLVCLGEEGSEISQDTDKTLRFMKSLEQLPPPDMVGPHGQAWLYDREAIRRIAKVPKEKDAGLVHWLIHAKWAHPLWHSYTLILIHLRDLPGVPAPKIYLQGATHEIMLFALDPEQPRRVDHFPRILQPANFAAQFIESSDASAVTRVKQRVVDIMEGELSPDTDFIQHWIQLFNASMIKGDPSRAGETVIIAQGSSRKVLMGPRPRSFTTLRH